MTHYDPTLVALSILMGVLAARMALGLAARVTAPDGPPRREWLAAGAVAMGIGIWSVHFIGILALHLPVRVTYTLPLSLLATMIAVSASFAALLVASRPRLGRGDVAEAGVVMGIAIAGMHYTGMAAMRFPGSIRYRPGLVALSIAVAVAASLAWVSLSLLARGRSPLRRPILRWGGASALGLAFSGMHYTAMSATEFSLAAGAVPNPRDAPGATHGLAIGVVIGALTLLGIVSWALARDRRLRRQEAAARDAAHRNRLLEEAQELARVGNWELDSATGRFTCSRQMYRIFGLTEQEATSSAPFLERVHPDDRGPMRHAVRAALTAHRVFTTEFRVVLPDGAERVVQARGERVAVPGEEKGRVLGTVQDITEQRLSEQEIRSSEAYFRALTENAYDIITVLDAEGRVRFESPSVTQLLGYTPEEMLGRDIFEFVHPDHAAAARQALERVRNGDFGNPADIRFRHKSGSWRILRTIARNLLQDPAVRGLVINARDVTERREAERRLAVEHAVTELLTHSDNMTSAMPKILSVLGNGLGWDATDFWCVEREAEVLVFSGQWSRDPSAVRNLEALSSRLVFLPGVGIPGRAWFTRRPVWVERIDREPRFLRCSAAAADRVQTALALPIFIGSECFGVIELLSIEQRAEDPALVAAMLSIGSEISQFIKRRTAEEALRQSESYFRALTENARDIVTVLDREGRIRYQSPAVERELGYRPEEMLGLVAFDLIHRDDVERTRETFERAMRDPGVPFEVELRFRHRTNTWSNMQVTVASLLDNPAVRGVVCNSRNTTAQVEAETELRETHATLSALVQNAPLGIVVVDTRFYVQMWNPGAESIFGWTAREILHRPYPVVQPDKEEEASEFRQLHFIEGRGMSGVEIQRRRKDGSLVDLLLQTEVLFDDEGKPRGAVAFMVDITERKRMEEQLRHAQKMDAVGRLAGGIAHDFNNLLTAIKGNSQLALLDLPEGSSVREDVEVIDQVADRATALTRQLLAFGRRQVRRTEVLDLARVVTEVEKILRRLLGEHIEIRTVVDACGCNVEADAGQLEQVLVNLAVNARDAMPHGGRLTIEVRPVEFPREAASMHPYAPPGSPAVELRVTDTGTGMDGVTAQRVFEPFFTTKPPGEGTGLGMSTVYGIVKQSGGYIWIDSAPGEGTTVRIYLPRSPEPARVEHRADPPSLLRGSEAILVVEDEPSVRDLVVRVLSSQGYRVTAAGDGVEALQLAAASATIPDLVLTDVVMPRMGGKELARELRGRHGITRILFMSGYAEDAIAHSGVLESGIALVEKPFTPNDLLRAVRTALDAPVAGGAEAGAGK